MTLCFTSVKQPKILWILCSDIVFHIGEAAKRGGKKVMLLQRWVSPVQNCAGGDPDGVALGMFPLSPRCPGPRGGPASFHFWSETGTMVTQRSLK